MFSPSVDAFVDELESLCTSHGFPLFGIASAVESERFVHLCEWLNRGYQGSMHYLQERRDAYRHPRYVLEECRSVVMLGMPYAPNPDTFPRKSTGSPNSGAPKCSENFDARVGNYAIGQVDYHDYIRKQLHSIQGLLQDRFPQSRWRGVVDTAPLLERDYARMAGLGWIGKNTLLLNREWGSYFFLAALLTDLELPSANAAERDHCGTCTACLDICPTEAFPQPGVMNASRCISYLTIEHRGRIDEELRPGMGDWIFGCDLCQIVCPWNRKRNADTLEVFQPDHAENKKTLAHWLNLDEERFRALYKKTPFWRTKLRGMQRNALIAAGNTKRSDLLPIIECFENSDDETLAETARWARCQILG